MKLFYLQREPSKFPEEAEIGMGREFIDDHLHDGCVELSMCEAESWKQAKQELAP